MANDVLCPRIADSQIATHMKSQDIVLLLKLVSLHRQIKAANAQQPRPPLPSEWEGWENVGDEEWRPPESAAAGFAEKFTARGLEAAIGVGKSEINKALNRCMAVGLALRDRHTGYPTPHTAALLEFIMHGLKYVFPAMPGPMVRGIPTAAAAPVLAGELGSAGSYIQVWPDPLGKAQGERIEPLYKSVPYAVRRDAELYATLALVDVIRLGKPREVAVARKLLESLLSI
jgi:hypothetical protein